MSRRRRIQIVHGHPKTMVIHTRSGPGLGSILLHTILTVITGGFWLIVLAIRYLLR